MTPDDLSAALATVADVEIDYWADAADAVVNAAISDPRFEPDTIDATVRRVIAAWIRAVADGHEAELRPLASVEVMQAVLHPPEPAAGTAGTQLIVRAPRVRACWVTGFALTGGSAQVTVSFLCAGRRWVQDVARGTVLSGERDTDEAMGDHEFWTFSEDWTLSIDPDGSCRLESASSGALADALGYRYLTRDETAEEFAQRSASPPPDRPQPTSSRVHRYLLVADAVDDDVHCGSAASLVVEHDGMPTRVEAEALIMPSLLADLRAACGDLAFQPRLRRLEAHRLLD